MHRGLERLLGGRWTENNLGPNQKAVEGIEMQLASAKDQTGRRERFTWRLTD
jgi:hypothetical protein